MYVDNVFLCASLNIIGMIIPSLTYLRSHNNTDGDHRLAVKSEYKGSSSKGVERIVSSKKINIHN